MLAEKASNFLNARHSPWTSSWRLDPIHSIGFAYNVDQPVALHGPSSQSINQPSTYPEPALHPLTLLYNRKLHTRSRKASSEFSSDSSFMNQSCTPWTSFSPRTSLSLSVFRTALPLPGPHLTFWNIFSLPGPTPWNSSHFLEHFLTPWTSSHFLELFLTPWT